MIATRQIRTGDTVRLREGDLVRLGTVEEIHGEYAYIKREGETLITSAMIGTFETVDARKERPLFSSGTIFAVFKLTN
jgi:hypothetical protein